MKRSVRKARYIVYRQTILDPIDHFWTFVGAFLGIGLIGYTQSEWHDFELTEKVFLIGSFGASAVLVYGATNSPLAQPRNLILGHLISAFVGVTVFKTVGSWDIFWLSCSLAVALAIIGMQVFRALHPPGGATALIAVIGTERVKELGYYYLLSPVFSGVIILFLVAILVNNIPNDRTYPYQKSPGYYASLVDKFRNISLKPRYRQRKRIKINRLKGHNK